MNDQGMKQPETQAPSTLAEVRDGLEELERVINEHEKRIAVILVSEQPTPENDRVCSERQPESKLTEEKREVAERIDRLQSLVISITQRVQM